MTKKIKQSPKLPADKRREQLLTAARRLFVRKGYRGTTTEEIAAAAGVTKGAVYFHFARKEDILLEILRSSAHKHDEALCNQLTEKSTLTDLFGLLLDLHCSCKGKDFGEIVDLWMQGFREPQTRRYITGRIQGGLVNIGDFVHRTGFGSARESRDLAMLMLALVDGLSAMRLLLPAAVDLDAQVKLFKNVFDNSRKAGPGKKPAIRVTRPRKASVLTSTRRKSGDIK